MAPQPNSKVDTVVRSRHAQRLDHRFHEIAATPGAADLHEAGCAEIHDTPADLARGLRTSALLGDRSPA